MQSIDAHQKSANAYRRGIGSPQFPTTPRLREYEACDIESLLRLTSEEQFQKFASSLEPFASCQSLAKWLATLSENRCQVVAEVANEFAGFAGLYILPDRSNHVGWFFIGVFQRFQDQGIGTYLMHAILAIADVLFGLTRIQLIVLCDNEKAIHLYHKFGFEIEGRHRRFQRRGQQFVDALSMARLREPVGAPADQNEMFRRQERLSTSLRRAVMKASSIHAGSTSPAGNEDFHASTTDRC